MIKGKLNSIVIKIGKRSMSQVKITEVKTPLKMTVYKLLLRYFKKLLTDLDELWQDGKRDKKKTKFESQENRSKGRYRGQITVKK